MDFLTGRPHMVRVGNNTSATLILNTGAPQWCVLVPSYTPCSPMTACPNLTFADDTTMIGLITDNNDTTYREVRDLEVLCQDNDLSPQCE
jgi:hypothetical protein